MCQREDDHSKPIDRRMSGGSRNGADDELLAAAVHEARRPLALARGYAELLRSGTLGGLTISQRGALDRIEEKLGEAGAQLDRLAQLHRYDPDRPDAADLVLEEELARAVDRARAKADLCGASFDLRLRGETPIWADPDLLGQVFDNLIDNALVYSDREPRIRLQTSDGSTARVEVTDQGIGLSEDGRHRLFDPAFRAHPEDSTRPGSGLGLYLSRRAAERMGGSLVLDATEPGGGSTFVLELPRVRS